MYFVGDSFKVGNSILTVVNIYPPGTDKYGRVELTVKGRNGFKKVFLDKFDYYIVDSSHAVVVLDVDTSSLADRNVTLGICPPTRLPVKLSRVELASASLSPKEFLIKVNGRLVKLDMDHPFKGKGVFIKLTAVSTSSNALERKGALIIDIILQKNKKVEIDGQSVKITDIRWDRLPSMRKVVISRGLESLTLGEGGSAKISDRVTFKVIKVGKGYVELIFTVKSVALGENFVIPGFPG